MLSCAPLTIEQRTIPVPTAEGRPRSGTTVLAITVPISGLTRNCSSSPAPKLRPPSLETATAKELGSSDRPIEKLRKPSARG